MCRVSASMRVLLWWRDFLTTMLCILENDITEFYANVDCAMHRVSAPTTPGTILESPLGQHVVSSKKNESRESSLLCLFCWNILHSRYIMMSISVPTAMLCLTQYT
jgi:hypothetical protein